MGIQINLNISTGKISLEISHEYTQIMKSTTDRETLHEVTKKADKWKYLVEWIQPNGHNKETQNYRKRKMELIYKLTQRIYTHHHHH